MSANTDNAALTAAANDHLARYHHPHFVSMEPTPWPDQVKVLYRLFDGTEPQPQCPSESYQDRELSIEDRDLLEHEYSALRTAWGVARFKRQARTLLEKAAPVWKNYLRARKAMDATFAAFWEMPDLQWKAQTLKLTDTHTETLTAARTWDEVAEELAKLQREHGRTVGEEDEIWLADLGPEFGMDLSGWSIGCVEEYKPNLYRTDTPLVREVKEVIGQQKVRLQEVSGLVGDR